jgi:hypothetical protein
MSDVLLSGADRKRLSVSLPFLIQPRQRDARPPPCGRCGGTPWWNGWRETFPVVATAAAAVVERWQLALPWVSARAASRPLPGNDRGRTVEAHRDGQPSARAQDA